MSRDDAYLLDLLLMAKDAHEFTKNQTRESFLSDRKGQYAVIRCLEVIGEVSKRLSPETIRRFSSIEWSSMARMRDMLIHSYGKVDLDEIWDTVKEDIPHLIATLEPCIDEFERQ
ncbi:HepT-like ribonuclease domain-containing protein [Methanoregula formicica]|uniref:DUF86 domain-containing protein n=2 Tax=Methanoregula TaxID=395331 RepID=L0HFN8_METFS|nr:DUF86 domain-containing protein [Methanoregula formicica]AGB02820.1 hypothetical protein Metfor_1797 [Methanoregula formicica SMSP]